MIIGTTREHHEKVSSTNTVASAKLRGEKPSEGLLITASFQESGRGQAGNGWESEAGKNLIMSTIIYPSMVAAEDQFVISQMVSLAVFDLLRHETSEVKIKWPNDIYVRDDKIAGILIENSLMGNKINNSIIGIGLNVNQTKFSQDIPNPISLKKITGKEYDLEKLIDSLSELLDMRYSMIIKNERKKLQSDYHNALYRCLKWHKYRNDNGEFSGMIQDVRTNGVLRVKHNDGSVREYAFREIEYIL